MFGTALNIPSVNSDGCHFYTNFVHKYLGSKKLPSQKRDFLNINNKVNPKITSWSSQRVLLHFGGPCFHEFAFIFNTAGQTLRNWTHQISSWFCGNFMLRFLNKFDNFLFCLRILLFNKGFEDCPDVFHWVNVRRVGGPLQKLHRIIVEKIHCFFARVRRCPVLFQYPAIRKKRIGIGDELLHNLHYFWPFTVPFSIILR